MSSNYLYKGVNIISQITQHETGAEDISGYSGFPHTVTNYTSQRPLDFGYYSNSGNEKSAINEQCSALRNKFVNSANEIQIPDNCKGVRVEFGSRRTNHGQLNINKSRPKSPNDSIGIYV